MAQAKTFSAQELRRVLDHVSTRAHAQRNRAIILLQHLAGLRVGECAALTWVDVVNEIHLRAEQTKRAHARTVFVSERLRKELQRYVDTTTKRTGDWAFFYTQQKPRRGFTANTLANHVRWLYRNAGIDGASSHSGRRSFATNLANQGTGIRVLMRLMGHRNISTTAVYIDANDDMLRRAVELA
jgi:integrase/recombinase XerD